MKEFKVGDRVAVYGYDSENTYWLGESATVTCVGGEFDSLVLQANGGDGRYYGCSVHKKQCRKLKARGSK